MTASGCGVMVKEYGYWLQHDPQYAEKAAKVSELTRDIVEVLAAEDLSGLKDPPGVGSRKRVAFQSPCTLQHGQKLAGRVEGILSELGFTLTTVPDPHLCFGSAGTYSLLHRRISERLRDSKLEALGSDNPEVIATANIGCLAHLQAGAGVPVMHWINLVDRG